jgi:predicted SnoaL-like aldol condensation-catalyzing enzyme
LTEIQGNSKIGSGDILALEKVTSIFKQALLSKHSEVVAKVKDGKLVYLHLTIKADLGN